MLALYVMALLSLCHQYLCTTDGSVEKCTDGVKHCTQIAWNSYLLQSCHVGGATLDAPGSRSESPIHFSRWQCNVIHMIHGWRISTPWIGMKLFQWMISRKDEQICLKIFVEFTKTAEVHFSKKHPITELKILIKDFLKIVIATAVKAKDDCSI